jgi:lipooligosaccharide transport system permease protein
MRPLEREVHVFRRLWRGSVSFAFVQPLLFLGAMGFGLGGLIDQNTGDVEGVKYVAFIAPGLLAGSTMLVGGSEAMWPLMGRLKWIGSYKAMIATPITPADAYRGWLVWIGVRSAVAAVAFLVAATIVGAVPSLWAPLAVPAAVLNAVAFAAPIGAYNATQDTDFRFPVIMRLVIMPLFLFSGTFFPVDRLPDGTEPFVWLSPLFHGAELCRSATTGHLELVPAVAHVVLLAALVVLGTRWGVRTFTRRLTP